MALTTVVSSMPFSSRVILALSPEESPSKTIQRLAIAGYPERLLRWLDSNQANPVP
jgi:hypothetical protein